MSQATLRDLVPSDTLVWHELWHHYLAFYKKQLPEAVTAHTWERLLAPTSPFACRVAEINNIVVGLAIHYLHESSWATRPYCYLEDLYVAPAHRGAGIGRALIDDLLAMARTSDWDTVYWQTDATNSTARRLYDHYGPSTVVRYAVELASSRQAPLA